MSTRALIEQILEQKRFAVTGVSRNPEKYGYVVYKALKAAGYTVFAVNPNNDTVDGDTCYPSIDNVPEGIDVLVTVTPPEITETTIPIAGRLEIPYVWMQPGSESTIAFNLARSNSMQVVSGGPCIMVSVSQRVARDAQTV